MENYQTRVTPAKEDAVAALRDEFKDYADIIVANRMDDRLKEVKEKVYTRDIYSRD